MLFVSLFLSLAIFDVGAGEAAGDRNGPALTTLQSSKTVVCDRPSAFCRRASNASSIKQRIADDRIQGGTCGGRKKGDCCHNDSNGQCVARCASDGGDCNPTQ
jgi:hypothetical protein